VGLVGGFRLLSGCGSWGNCSKNHCRCALYDFQAFGKQLGIAVPKLDVVGRCGSGLKSNGLTHHKGHGLGFGLAYLFCGQGSPFTAVQHLMRHFKHEG
jgi:hypothetical protein